jgi:hypothetical protein
MELLLVITAVALLASLVADRRKTRLAVRKGLMMFMGLVPTLLGVLAAVSVLLAAIPPATLSRALSGGGVAAVAIALLAGSVALIPGFIAYPLAGVLKDHGATTAVLSGFITTLLMVGVVTLPIEIRYFGRRIAVVRNALAFAGAVLVAAIMTIVLR